MLSLFNVYKTILLIKKISIKMDNAQLLFTYKYLFLCSVIIFIDIVSFLSIAVYKLLMDQICLHIGNKTNVLLIKNAWIVQISYNVNTAIQTTVTLYQDWK